MQLEALLSAAEDEMEKRDLAIIELNSALNNLAEIH